MAILNAADYRDIRKTIYRVGFGKEELKALTGGMPNETQLLAGFQSMEDRLVAQFANFKTDFQTAIGGKTITNAGMQKVLAGYLVWKINNLLGS